MPFFRMTDFKIRGLCAAAHTPFDASGALNLAAVEAQANRLLSTGIRLAFIGGSTGESHSLSFAERRALAERWLDVAKGSDLKVIVHVGSNCLTDGRELAAHAAKHGAAAISMLTPSYFKPAGVDMLVRCCAQVASAAPELPFYYYDIPALTAVQANMEEFLTRAPAAIPNLAGIKFTNADFMQFQLCHRFEGGRFDIPYGNDEYFLGAYAMGARGAVGSTFNFAPGIYRRMMAAAERGDYATAADEQFRSVLLVKALAKRGYMGAAKALMVRLGVPVGPARLPQGNPGADALKAMFAELDGIGFFAWND